MEDAIFRFYETEKETATNLFGNIINTHPFEDGNGRICCLILAHVLIQMKCCLFPVILSSFHKRGRRHYIRTVKMFDRKSSMLYTMIVKSLIHCWDIFEQNARMLARCWHKNIGQHLPTDQKCPHPGPKFNKDEPWIVSKSTRRSNWNAFRWSKSAFVEKVWHRNVPRHKEYKR